MKSQVSVEFMMIFAVFMIILTLVAWVSLSKTQEINTIRFNLEINGVLNDVSNKINIAHLEGSGYSINTTLPQDISGYDYTLDIDSNQILMTINALTYSHLLLTKNVTGTFKKGNNMIRNKNGVIIIS